MQVAWHKPQGIIFLLNTRFKSTCTCEGEEREEGGGRRGEGEGTKEVGKEAMRGTGGGGGRREDGEDLRMEGLHAY